MGSRQDGPKTRCQLRQGFNSEAHTWTLVSLVLLLVIVLDTSRGKNVVDAARAVNVHALRDHSIRQVVEADGALLRLDGRILGLNQVVSSRSMIS